MYVDRKSLVFSFVIGLVATFLTSIFVNNVVVGELPEIKLSSLPPVGVTYWGYPLPWMKQTVYPNAVKQLILSHFFIDIVYWTGLVLIIEVYYLRNLKIKERIKEKVAKRVKVVRKLRPKRPILKKKKPKKKRKKKPKKKAKSKSKKRTSRKRTRRKRAKRKSGRTK